MAALMPRHVFVYPALFGYLFDAVFTDVIAWDRQQFAVLGNAFVFVDDVLRHIQQADVRFHSRFLAARLYPQMPETCRFSSVRFAMSRQLKPVKQQKMKRSRISS